MNFENDDIIHAPTTSSLILEERHDSELFRVYALILDGITDQVLLPGKKLTESELCRQMVCSRNTVRARCRFWRTTRLSICNPTGARSSTFPI